MPLMSCNLQRAETASTRHDCRNETDLQLFPAAIGNYLAYALTALHTLQVSCVYLYLSSLNESHRIWLLV